MGALLVRTGCDGCPPGEDGLVWEDGHYLGDWVRLKFRWMANMHAQSSIESERLISCAARLDGVAAAAAFMWQS